MGLFGGGGGSKSSSSTRYEDWRVTDSGNAAEIFTSPGSLFGQPGSIVAGEKAKVNITMQSDFTPEVAGTIQAANQASSNAVIASGQSLLETIKGLFDFTKSSQELIVEEAAKNRAVAESSFNQALSAVTAQQAGIDTMSITKIMPWLLVAFGLFLIFKKG
jgi:hypothetical protein